MTTHWIGGDAVKLHCCSSHDSRSTLRIPLLPHILHAMKSSSMLFLLLTVLAILVQLPREEITDTP